VLDLKESTAFSPGHITGFFQICDQPKNPLLKGSRGAGISITRGVTTKVRIEESAKKSITIMINGHIAKSALVSKHILNSFLSIIESNYRVNVEHEVKLPIGCGFGSSGAGALSLALALNEIFHLNMSRLKAAQIAHIAEVECKTGLGTVIAETFGGLEIRVKPGAPGIGEIESVATDDELNVVCLNFGPIPTRKILADEFFRKRINEYGGSLVDQLTTHPTPNNFMKLSRKFSEYLGLISSRVRKVLHEIDALDITCSTPMLGESIFTIVSRNQLDKVQKVLGNYAPPQNDVIIAEIDKKGARLL